MPRIFLLVILLGFFELYVMIQVGRTIGALPTILLLLLTSFIGLLVLRRQGQGMFEKARGFALQGNMQQFNPGTDMLGIVAGILLIIPGFITDVFALLLLLPPVRRLLARRWGGVVNPYAGTASAHQETASPKVIEGEYTRED